MRSPRLLLVSAFLFLFLWPVAAGAAEIKVTTDQAYKTHGTLSSYEKTRCRLDVYAPVGAKDRPCIVWFHGGFLVSGSKAGGDVTAVARALASEGIVVAVPNYRLSPKVTYPAYLEDGAAALAWMRAHAESFGGDPKKLFVGGHSAGGYLATMLGTDPRWLQGVGMKLADLAGVVSLSGQMFTHCTVRAERGLPATTVVIDDAAPVNHVSRDLPPLLLLYADHDMPFRGLENRYFAEALQAAGDDDFTIRLISDRNHGSINARIAQPGDEARTAIVDFVSKAER